MSSLTDYVVLHNILWYDICFFSDCAVRPPPTAVSSSMVGHIKHRIPDTMSALFNGKCHVHCKKDNLQQPLIHISFLELVVVDPLQGKQLPVYHHPFQLVANSTLIHMPIPC